MPLYKSGDPSQCNNYRGIAISSCLGKLSTNILKTRLLRYVEDENKFSDNQSAFRKGRCTSDHLFTIKSILNKYLKSLKKDVYSCFVDFSKAFDTVWRKGLFIKLLKSGVNSQMYRVIKNMYSNTITSVKTSSGISESFATNCGIRQGGGLSPLLFCLFIDDLNMIFDQACAPCKIDDLYINHLLYVDDLVLISENAMGLQRCLDNLNIFL